MLSEAERAGLQIPMPAWMENDPLRRSFDLYSRLWGDGKVVWGMLIQANNALFEQGTFDAPGEVVYDPAGQASIEALGYAAQQIGQLKHTQPADAALRAVADYLTDEHIRVRGMRVPSAISAHSLLISTVFFGRKHLPNGMLEGSHFPLLINERYPGAAMVLPSRWWPDEFHDEWCGNSPGTRARDRVKAEAEALASHDRSIDVAGGQRRCCGNCRQPMRKLGLAAHYKHQKPVEIDVCEPCSLIWFDDTESVRLAGPGLADLVRVIHRSMNGERPLEPLPLTLPCPLCAEPLKRVPNISRFGRTTQLECPQKHGAYQTFAQFLAEKGYFRPFNWADIKQVLASGKRLLCFNCGAALDPRPHDECQYCRSSVGLLDPARLAQAIDTEGAAAKLTLAPGVTQSSCPCCGGAIDLSGEMACPHCKAIVRPEQMQGALAASESVEAQVRRNHEAQQADISRRKLEAMAMMERPASSLPSSESVRRFAILAIVVVALGFVAIGQVMRKAHEAQVAENKDLQNDDMIGLSPTMKRAIVANRAEEAMKKIPHAPQGEAPPQLTLMAAGERVTLVSKSDHPLRVSVNLFNENREVRCKMTSTDGPAGATTAIFRKSGDSHDFVAQDCQPIAIPDAKNEFIVYDMDEKRTVFKSDSAFYIF
jgi:hypothetical protein